LIGLLIYLPNILTPGITDKVFTIDLHRRQGVIHFPL
jgi:hypothetical protein